MTALQPPKERAILSDGTNGRKKMKDRKRAEQCREGALVGNIVVRTAEGEGAREIARKNSEGARVGAAERPHFPRRVGDSGREATSKSLPWDGKLA